MRSLFSKFYMRLAFTTLVLTILSYNLAYSQQVDIKVVVGSEPAQYAYIYHNGIYLGISDSLGRYTSPEGVIKKGDKLSAEYVCTKSEEIIYNEKKSEVTIRIPENRLREVTILSDKSHTLEEFIKIIGKHKTEYDHRFQKYKADYYIDSKVDSLKFKTSGFIEFIINPVAGHISVTKKECFLFLSHNSSSDSTVLDYALRYSAFTTSYAIIILAKNINKEYIRRRVKKRNMLILKAINEDETISYIIMEGQKRDNQTAIVLDKQRDKIVRIERKFIGGGYQVNADEATEHTALIKLNNKDNNLTVAEGFMTYKDKGDAVAVKITNIQAQKLSKQDMAQLAKHKNKKVNF